MSGNVRAASGACPEERRGLLHRLRAAGCARGCERHERAVAGYKRALFAGLTGTVVEIGPGAGVNLPYFPRDVRWIGIEPNVHMHPYIISEAKRLGMNVELRSGTAERLGLKDESADAVVSTLVLCSVTSPEQSLAEVKRILRPGGRFIFIEHVAAERGTRTRRIQRLVRPIWRILGGGCRPDRETAALIARAGFSIVKLERFRVALPVVGPHIAGEAVRRAE